VLAQAKVVATVAGVSSLAIALAPAAQAAQEAFILAEVTTSREILGQEIMTGTD